MEYAKDIVYNLKFDKMVNKNKSWTSKFKQRIKERKITVITIALLTVFICLDCLLIMNFIKLLKIL